LIKKMHALASFIFAFSLLNSKLFYDPTFQTAALAIFVVDPLNTVTFTRFFRISFFLSEKKFFSFTEGHIFQRMAFPFFNAFLTLSCFCFVFFIIRCVFQVFLGQLFNIFGQQF
jgi:hypothetical protein